jgi:hypothetical protein
VKKIGASELTDALGKIIEDLKVFVIPPLRSLARGEEFTYQWKALDGWVVT